MNHLLIICFDELIKYYIKQAYDEGYNDGYKMCEDNNCRYGFDHSEYDPLMDREYNI